MKRPRDRKQAPNRTKPRYAVTMGFHSGRPKANKIPMWMIVIASMDRYRAIAPRNLPMTISKSVMGEVRRSSIVPDRISSEYVRIVIIGRRNRATTVTFWNTGLMSCWLTFIDCAPPMSPACMLWPTKTLRAMKKKNPYSSAKNPMTMYAMGDMKYDRNSLFAIARTLRIRHFSSGLRRRFVGGRERQEHILEAHARGTELEQAPAVRDHRLRELAPHVTSAFGDDFVPDQTVASIGLHDARDARDTPEG